MTNGKCLECGKTYPLSSNKMRKYKGIYYCIPCYLKVKYLDHPNLDNKIKEIIESIKIEA
jgi:hypothetical protein